MVMFGLEKPTNLLESRILEVCVVMKETYHGSKCPVRFDFDLNITVVDGKGSILHL